MGHSWKRWAFAAVIPAFGVGAWLHLTSVSPHQHIVIAESRQISSALIFVAQAEGFFADEGLDVELLPVANGKVALEAMLAGKAELCMSSDVPAASAMLKGQPFRILSTIQTSDRDIVIASKHGSGRTSPEALVNSRVGYSPDTSSQYFLDLLLGQAGLTERVTKVPYESGKIMAALAQGEIDAASVWTTVRINAAAMFPQGLDIISMPGLYTGSWILSGRSDVIDKRRDVLLHFVRALLEAENAVLRDQNMAIPIVAAATGIDETLVRRHWERYSFTLRLDQALLLSIEDHVRRAGGDPGPEMLNYLQRDILRTLDPTRVTVLD